MGEDMLSKIIETEKEIGEMIAAEQIKADEWLAKRREETAARLEEEELRLRQECAGAVEEAAADAEKRAAAMVREAVRDAERLASLDDHTLQRIIADTIRRILPGESS